MLHIGIAEDQLSSAQELKDYLARFAQEQDVPLEVVHFENGAQLLERYTPRFDVLLLDIEMPELDGMSAAQRIREMDSKVIIIFITNLAQYALKGYAVNALSYLLKPVNYYALSQELKRSVKQIALQQHHYIMIAFEQEQIRLDTREILFVERDEHRLNIVTDDATYYLVATVKDFEQRLEDAPFFRCNSGCLVNLEHVRAVRDDVAILGAHQVQISRAKKKPFLQALTNYLGGAGL